MDVNIGIGDLLKKIREDKDLHLKDVANNTNINYTLLSRIETGKRLPNENQIEILANYFNYDKNELLKQLISDKIIYEIKNHNLGLEAFRLIEEKINKQQSLFFDYESDEKILMNSRRYIGNKSKLLDWIFRILKEETLCQGTFIDIFAGTGIVSKEAMKYYDNIIMNDILYSNNIIYNAFFLDQEWSFSKIKGIVDFYNNLSANELEENYFSINFGNKFFEYDLAKIIGFIREDLEERKDSLNTKEYSILLASLIYSIDRLANTVGHFDAYIKKPINKKPLNLRLIQTEDFKNIEIYKEDANYLASKIEGDIAYIDPPYNSRQYSRFYHIYENLVQWKKPELFGVALKPEPENMSKYCTVKAKNEFKDLVENLNVKYLAVSYNNTYKSKSKSSENKIKYEEILEILNSVGKTKVFEQSHSFFNTGKTDFNDHKEYLFITKKHGH